MKKTVISGERQKTDAGEEKTHENQSMPAAATLNIDARRKAGGKAKKTVA